jgi:hypothetical protein
MASKENAAVSGSSIGFKDAVELIAGLARHDVRHVVYLEGAPGDGKTAAAVEAAYEMGFESDEIMLVRPSLHESVDYSGALFVEQGTARWAPMELMKRMTEKRAFVVIDEMADAPVMTQNVMCGVVYDRMLSGLVFHPETVFVLTGNRTIDRSGANRVVTKLYNRVCLRTFVANVDDWSTWADAQEGFVPWVSAFHRYNRGEYFSKFDPAERQSPTPRQWEKVAILPDELPAKIHMHAVCGYVGDAAAAAYGAFRAHKASLPTREEVEKSPDTATLPAGLDAQWAVAAAVAQWLGAKNAAKLAEYIVRLPKDLQMMIWTSAPRRPGNETLITHEAWLKATCALSGSLQKAKAGK